MKKFLSLFAFFIIVYGFIIFFMSNKNTSKTTENGCIPYTNNTFHYELCIPPGYRLSMDYMQAMKKRTSHSLDYQVVITNKTREDEVKSLYSPVVSEYFTYTPTDFNDALPPGFSVFSSSLNATSTEAMDAFNTKRGNPDVIINIQSTTLNNGSLMITNQTLEDDDKYSKQAIVDLPPDNSAFSKDNRSIVIQMNYSEDDQKAFDALVSSFKFID